MGRSCDLLPSAEKGVHALLAQSTKSHTSGCPFSTEENSYAQESPSIIDGRSKLAVILRVLYIVEGLETESLK